MKLFNLFPRTKEDLMSERFKTVALIIVMAAFLAIPIVLSVIEEMHNSEIQKTQSTKEK